MTEGWALARVRAGQQRQPGARGAAQKGESKRPHAAQAAPPPCRGLFGGARAREGMASPDRRRSWGARVSEGPAVHMQRLDRQARLPRSVAPEADGAPKAPERRPGAPPSEAGAHPRAQVIAPRRRGRACSIPRPRMQHPAVPGGTSARAQRIGAIQCHFLCSGGAEGTTLSLQRMLCRAAHEPRTLPSTSGALPSTWGQPGRGVRPRPARSPGARGTACASAQPGPRECYST